MYISAEGCTAQAKRLEVIANNMANVDTAGFKQDVPTFQARFAEAIQQGLAQPRDGSINNVGGGVKIIDVTTDYSEGELKRTGQDLDFAITGKGFFQVLGEDGKQYLTRAGNFMLDTEGVLVTQNGQRPVLDQSGRQIQMDPLAPWNFSQDAFITQGSDVFALGLSEPDNIDHLTKVGDNLFDPLGNVKPVELEKRNVRQGYLEISGANPIRQMLAMIETTRAFEANTRMVQSQDTMIGTLIGRVLKA
jgi:flagellar basal-body rod protein FlgF